MTSYVTPKKGVEFIFYVSLPSVSSTSIFQANPTIAAGDFKVSIDGGAFNNPATLPAVTPASGKAVKVTLSTSEMNGDNIIFYGSDAAGGEWKDIFVNIQTSARQIDDLAWPTTTGRSLDVTATGAAGIDWGNVENPTTANALTATSIITTQKVDVETIKTNPVVNGGTVTFPANSTLASTTNITGGTVTTATNVTTVNGLAANVITAASMNADASAEIADAVWDEDATGHQILGTFGQAIGDPVADATTIYQAVVTDAAGTHIAADIIAIEAQTDDIGIAGAGLTAIPWNPAWDAEVQSEVNDALVAQRLDELLNADSDIDGLAPPAVGSVYHELLTKTAGSFTYDQTTDSLEALRDRGDAAWITATGFATPTNITAGTITTVTNLTNLPTIPANWLTAAGTDPDFGTEIGTAVWATTARFLTANTNLNDLNAAAVATAVWNAATATYGSVGSYGELIEINLDGTVSSRASQASLDTVDGIVDNILVDTAEVGLAGAGLTNINLPNQTMDIVGNITGNLSGSVGSVTGLTAANLDTTVSSRATPAQVNTEVLDVMTVDTFAEPAQGTPAATTTLATKLAFLYKAWRNKTTQTATTYSLFNDDAATVDHKSTTSDDGTTFSKTEIATGP